MHRFLALSKVGLITSTSTALMLLLTLSTAPIAENGGVSRYWGEVEAEPKSGIYQA